MGYSFTPTANPEFETLVSLRPFCVLFRVLLWALDILEELRVFYYAIRNFIFEFVIEVEDVPDVTTAPLLALVLITTGFC